MRRSCPKCGHHWSWSLNDGRFACRSCQHKYRWCSVWDSGRLSEATKCQLLEYFVLGVPAYRARFRSPVSRPTTERFFRLIRQVLALHEECTAPFEGAIECDETMFGGYRKGKRGWGAAGKVIVFGLLKRNGVVRIFAVSGRSRDELLGLIVTHTTPGCLYYTDDWHAYTSLAVHGQTDIFTRQCLGQEVDTSLGGRRVTRLLDQAAKQYGLPAEIQLDNGPEFRSKALNLWACENKVKLCFIEPGKPTQNGHIESFNGRFRAECLDQEWFASLTQARTVIEQWRSSYNSQRPHSSLGYMPPDTWAKQYEQQQNLML